MFYYRSCFFCSEISKKRAVSVAPKRHSAVINWCWFSVAFIDYWLYYFLLRTRKNPLLIVSIVRHSSIAYRTFFPTNASSFIRVLEQTHLFPFCKRKQEESRQNKQLLLGLLRVRVSGWDMKWFYDDEPISIIEIIIRWREEDLHTIWKGLCQTALRPDVSTQKTDAVSTIDLIGVDGEEHRFIDVGNEICFYSSFAIGCCGCQSDPGGNIDDATRKSKKFLVAMNSFSSSSSDCAEHWIALTCGPSTIDFVLGKVEGRMKRSLLINEQRCSFYCGKNNEMNELGCVNPKRNMNLTGGGFLHGFDLMVSARAQYLSIKMISEKEATTPFWFDSNRRHFMWPW